MNRRTLLSAISLIGGASLIAIGWWDHWNPNQINQWWAGERVYPYYWQRLVLTLLVVLPLVLIVWWLFSRLDSSHASPARRRERAAWGFAPAFVIPLILLLKYHVTWLGVNYGSSIWTYGFILALAAVIAWLLWPALSREGVLRWLDEQGPVVVFTAVMLYVIVYGGLSIARHASFRTHALDLGTMDQAMWNTSRGRLLEYTPLPVIFDDTPPDLSPDSRLVGGKSELIFLPLSLLYWLWADPRLLIAAQTILLASGAIPLYHLARSRLGDGVASLAITLGYLFYLPLHYVTLADFHASALMVPFLLWAWQAADREDWRGYYLAIGLSLLCRIDAALVLLGFGFYHLTGKERRRHGMVTLLLGAGWLLFSFGVVSPLAKTFYGGGTNELLPERYGQFGEGPADIALGMISRPIDALRLLLGREKFQTLIDLVATLGGLPLLAPLALLPALPVLILNLLSASPYQNSILAHYFAPVIPFVLIAALAGSLNAGRWIARRSSNSVPMEGTRLAALLALTATLLATIFFSPMPPGWKFRLSHFYQVGEHERSLARMLDLIPEDALVSAQSGLFPHLSRRRVIYLFPTVADAEYVVVDMDYASNKTPIDEFVFYPAVESLLADASYHVVAFDDGALLLQHAPGESPPGFAEALSDYRAGLYRSALLEYRGPTRLQADNLYRVKVALENRGTQSWKTVGTYPIYLSYHWWTAEGEAVEWDGLRNTLVKTVEPGDTLIQRARFVTPAQPGDYILEWDLVHENRTWFGDQGGITLRVEVRVE